MGRRTFGSARQLPSGRWQASYWHEGARYTAPNTFPTKADANAYLSNAETDILRGGWIDPAKARPLFRVVSKDWLGHNGTKRASSVERDRAIIQHHLNPRFGDRPVGSVRPAEIQAAVDAWAGTHASSTVARHYACLRAIFTYAETSDMILRSPCRGVRLPRQQVALRPRPRPEELEKLATALWPDQATFMWCGAALGMRWAEVAGLSVDRVDTLRGTVTVDCQLARNGELAEPKSVAGTRTLACPSWLIEDLSALMARRAVTAANPGALLFVNDAGAP
ncbi:MAG: hypothetical protein WB565_04200 [Acidimicrobiales bacterium]